MEYDVIIIGGGLSGLMAGALLSKKGKKVIVLEQHLTVGGLAAGFKRKGYYFDSAMSRINYDTLMKPLKELKILKKSDIRPLTSAMNIKGHTFDYRSLKEYYKDLARVFEKERSGIEAFYDEQVREREKIYLALLPDRFASASLLKKASRMLRIIKAMPSFIKNITSNENANDIIGGYLDKSGEAYTFFSVKEDELNYRGRMNIMMYVGKWYSQMINVYPLCGFQGVSEKLAAFITGNGGVVSTSSKVNRIVIENNRCAGVEAVMNGKAVTLAAKNVISAIDLKKTLFGLVGEELVDRTVAERLRKSRNTSPIMILYLGLNIPKEKIRAYFHGNEELYHFQEIKKTCTDLNDEKFFLNSNLILHSSCILNPENAPEGKCGIQAYMQSPPKGWMNDWGIKDGKRTDEYRRLKAMVIEHALQTIENVIPDIRDRSLIEVCELGTPYTVERYTGNTDGSGCGFTMDDEDYVNVKKPGKYFDRCEGIDNLYFIGHQSGHMGGATTAFASAKHIAKILG